MISYTLTQYDNMTDEQIGYPHHKQLDEQEERTLRLIANYDDAHRIVIERSGSIDIYEVEHYDTHDTFKEAPQ